MSSRWRRSAAALFAASALLAALAACGAPARPPQLARAAQVAASPASAEAETWAPQAHARAQQLEQRAEEALAGGDADAAALLAEQAIAAHEHAWALTRLARAERRRLGAEAELAQERRALEALRQEQQQLAAEAAGLELRARAAGGTLPVTLPAGNGGAPRVARREAVAALGTQARLLCVAARLLGEVQRVDAVVQRLDALERSLSSGAPGATLESAAALRRECLQIISDVRHRNVAPAANARPAPNSGRAPLPADVVLDELSAIGATPSRDERGVAVALRGLFGADGSITSGARQELASIGKVVDAHRDFPLLLVGHGPGRDLDQKLAAVKSELSRGGAITVETQVAGESLPLLPPASAGARERNARFELVFIAPGF